eukprot:2989721-Rhodomonas_salina.1
MEPWPCRGDRRKTHEAGGEEQEKRVELVRARAGLQRVPETVEVTDSSDGGGVPAVITKLPVHAHSCQK